jgi:DNA-binding MarR family transcriptional regulator
LLSQEEVARLLSPQQEIIWKYIISRDRYVSPLEIGRATKIPRPTINQALEKLLRLKWIEKRAWAGQRDMRKDKKF